MSIPDKMPGTIRKAKDEEFDVIGKLHASAFAENPVYNILFSKMEPSVALQWLWIDGAKQWMAKGVDTVLVLERADTGEMVGVARYNKYNDGFKPALWDDSEVLYPEGFNKEENSRMAVPIVHWQQELMAKYGQFLYLQDFVIAPAHQKHGLGTTFMLEIVALAKEEGMNIALTAGPEESEFWAKLGFQQVGEPIEYGEGGTNEGIFKMLLEQFKPPRHEVSN